MAKTLRSTLPIVLALVAVLSSVSPALGQAHDARPYATLFLQAPVQGAPAAAPEAPLPDTIAAALLPPAPDIVQAIAPVAAPAMPDVPRAPRGVLPALYAGFGTLQTLDAHSTLRAIDAGHVEQNPMMAWTTDHPAVFVSIKAAATIGTILVTEQIRKKHPKRAILFIAAINAAYAVVVAHNYRVGSR